MKEEQRLELFFANYFNDRSEINEACEDGMNI